MSVRQTNLVDVFTNQNNSVDVTDVHAEYRTRVNIHGRPISDDPVDGKDLLVEATLKVTALVGTPVAHGYCCAGCHATPPLPALDDDEVLMFLLANHDGARLLFAEPEDCKADRDRYPVRGWRRTFLGFLCPECQTKAKNALHKGQKP